MARHDAWSRVYGPAIGGLSVVGGGAGLVVTGRLSDVVGPLVVMAGGTTIVGAVLLFLVVGDNRRTDNLVKVLEVRRRPVPVPVPDTVPVVVPAVPLPEPRAGVQSAAEGQALAPE